MLRARPHRRAACAAALIAVACAGCGGDTVAGASQPQIAWLQLNVANQIVEIDRNGQMIDGPIEIRAGVDVSIEATFLRLNRTPDPLVTAAEYQLNVSFVGGTASVTFTRSLTDPFAGILRSNVGNTSGTLRFSLHHVEEQKDYWGPFDGDVVVIL